MFRIGGDEGPKMSLVGKDVEVSLSSPNTTLEETDEDASADGHPPLSPPSSAEALFLPGLRTSDVSANFLATELHRNYRPLRSSSTVATDDFVSAVETMDDLLSNPERNRGFFGFIKQPIQEFEEDPKMSTTSSTNDFDPDTVKPDPATHVYETAKNVWGWGKEQMIISTFLGITEAVAGKVVSMVGTDFEEIDHNIQPKLSDFDLRVLNPAIRAVLAVVMNVAGKSENFLKPIIVSVLKPIGLIKDGKMENAPELTNSRVAVK